MDEVRWTCGWKSQNDCKKKIVKGQKSAGYTGGRESVMLFSRVRLDESEDDKVGKRQV